VNFLVPELRDLEHVLDKPVECLMGKAKRFNMKRPDYFHVNRDSLIGLHGEYDEKLEHEDSDERLESIRKASGMESTYIYRIAGHHGIKDKSLTERRVRNKTHVSFKLTDEGLRVAEEVAEAIRDRIQWMEEGLFPDDEAGREAKIYF
jgi:hypothetical protein